MLRTSFSRCTKPKNLSSVITLLEQLIPVMAYQKELDSYLFRDLAESGPSKLVAPG